MIWWLATWVTIPFTVIELYNNRCWMGFKNISELIYHLRLQGLIIIKACWAGVLSFHFSPLALFLFLVTLKANLISFLNDGISYIYRVPTLNSICKLQTYSQLKPLFNIHFCYVISCPSFMWGWILKKNALLYVHLRLSLIRLFHPTKSSQVESIYLLLPALSTCEYYLLIF